MTTKKDFLRYKYTVCTTQAHTYTNISTKARGGHMSSNVLGRAWVY